MLLRSRYEWRSDVANLLGSPRIETLLLQITKIQPPLTPASWESNGDGWVFVKTALSLYTLSSFNFPERHFTPQNCFILNHITKWQNSLSVDKDTEAHLAIAGEGGVVKQEIGTKEEDNSIKHTQARPVQEDGPAEKGVLGYVSEREGYKKKGQLSNLSRHFILDNQKIWGGLEQVTSPVQGGLPLECLHGDMLLYQAVEEDWEWGEADVVQRQICRVVQRLPRDKHNTWSVRHLKRQGHLKIEKFDFFGHLLAATSWKRKIWHIDAL